MKKLTLQQIFTVVYEGLAKQKFKRAADRDGICQYRGREGMSCAIGQLLTDAEANRLKEVHGDSPYNEVRNYLPKRLDVLKKKSRHDTSLGAQLQDCHDDGETPARMKEYLHDFAERHRLKVPKVSS